MSGHSALYTGTLMHERRGRVQNRFTYPVCFFLLDLDEVPDLDRRLRLFAHNGRGVVSFRDDDHLGERGRSAKENVVTWLAERDIDLQGGSVHLMTNLRMLGYVFNPVSFFYCYDRGGELVCVVAEVANTFGERRPYLLDMRGATRLAAWQDKELHVSPFFGMDQRYEFAFSPPGERIAARVDVYEGDERVLRASQVGTRRPLTDASLARVMCRYPLMSWQVSLLIHRQAARLLRKKVHFHPKPPFDPRTGTRTMTTSPTERTAVPTPSPAVRTRELRPLPAPRRTPAWPAVRSLVMWTLAQVASGRLRVQMPDGTVHRFGSEGREVALTITSRDLYHRLLQRGRVGIGEAYQAGDWYADDLPAALEVLAATGEAVRHDPRFDRIIRLLAKRPHLPSPNGLVRARQQIQYHYDLGNDLYGLFLDETWAYSCAIFASPDETLEQAQINKFRRICQKLALTPDDHVLEIGCGWGGFAIHAASEWGARVTGVTISDEQFALARERVRAAGVEDRVTILKQDYRTLSGTFSKIASVEMFEAIGDKEFGRFFATCDRLLAPGGWACIQTIAVPDQRYERYRRGHDWIREYIFPGAVIPSLEAVTRSMTKSSDLIVHDVENIGIHYAETLKRWRERFLANTEQVLGLGFDMGFVRTWEFYLAFCEAAFRIRSLLDYQLVITRPFNTALPVESRPAPTA